MTTTRTVLVAAISASVVAAAGFAVGADAGPHRTPGGTTIECVAVNEVDSIVIVSRGRQFEIFPQLVDCTAGIPADPAD